MAKFTINGKEYESREITFNFMCLLEDRGITLDDIENKPLKFAREYLAYCGRMDSEVAGKEIENHVIAGGNFNVLYDVINEAMAESGFFRAMGEEEETAPKKKTTAKKTAED